MLVPLAGQGEFVAVELSSGGCYTGRLEAVAQLFYEEGGDIRGSSNHTSSRVAGNNGSQHEAIDIESR